MILFPGALGDFLCFLPTADAVRRSSGEPVTLVTRGAFRPLLADGRFRFVDIDRREVAGLFALERGVETDELLGGFRRALSWIGHNDEHFRDNLTAITAGAVDLFNFDSFRSGAHAIEQIADRAGVRPGRAELAIDEDARRWAHQTWARLGLDHDTMVIHAGSGSPRKNWEGMADLAALWRDRGTKVVAIEGPADSEIAFSDAVLRDQPLDRIAAFLALANFFVGNDSGISHLAAAASCPGIALFGDTDPTIWHPSSPDIHVMHAPRQCESCGPDRFCTHRLGALDVLEQVDRMRRESYCPAP